MHSEVLFGSRVRAEVLETLASTSKPLTAYRLAKVAGAEPIQVGRILKSLEPELVRSSAGGWVLVNEPLRLFLRGLVALREAETRAEKDELLVQLGMKARRRHGR